MMGLHFLGDFVFQPKYMIEDKMKGDAFGYLTLVAHCAVHGFLFGAFFYLLGMYNWFEWGFLMFVIHYLIDVGKINHTYNVWIDQTLHYLFILGLWISLI